MIHNKTSLGIFNEVLSFYTGGVMLKKYFEAALEIYVVVMMIMLVMDKHIHEFVMQVLELAVRFISIFLHIFTQVVI